MPAKDQGNASLGLINNKNMSSEEFEYIERFYEGDLTPEEQREFERIKSENKEFASKVSDYKQIVTGIQNFHQEKFLNKLDNWDREESKENFFNTNRVYLRAAAAVLLIMIPIGIWLITTSSPYQSLYQKYYQPYPDVVSNRSLENNFQEAMEAYNNAQYEQAISFLKPFRDSNEFPLAKIYLAECYLNIDETESAKSIFIHLKKVSNIRDLAEWRLALINLRQANVEATKELLNDIVNSPGHDYQANAEELLAEIED